MLQTGVVFQDRMVLQRNKLVNIWGTGDQGKQVTVKIQGKEAKTIVDSDGKWKVMLPELDASDEEQLGIESDNENIIYKSVAIGEVWVAGGQSNMEFWMRYEKHKSEALKVCPNYRLRFYDVPEVCYDGQLKEFDYSRQGIWREATSENLDYFSAVGFYFQKELMESLNVPVGIIGCNWGGTPSCAWMNPATVIKVGEPWMKEYEDIIAKMDMEEYWRDQHYSSMNDRGNPFADPFIEFCLPVTPSPEETRKFFAGLSDNFENNENKLQPQTIPGCLYEHMLKTIAPFSIKGFLWYQGERDDVPGKNVLYKDMLTGLISDWRMLWHDRELPFLLVQLPGFEKWLMFNDQHEYPIIRRCQQEVTESVENAYLCSISDAGEENDIHPKNKKVVGHRLALLARGHVYGETLLCDPPKVREVQREGSRLAISFDNADGGLKIIGDYISALNIYCNGRELEHVAGIEGDQIIIYFNGSIDGKIIVKFAQTSWYLVNLYNQAEIPAIPFELSIS